MLFHEDGWPTVMMETVSQLMGNGKPCKQGSTDLGTQIRVHTGDVLHIHLMEDVGEELHAMIVIDGHELVILLLSNLVADAFTVDYGCHSVKSVTLSIQIGRAHV